MDCSTVGRYTVWLWVFAVVWSTSACAEAIRYYFNQRWGC